MVFRNHLLEVIHYAPTTDRVRAMPIVITTPWINKFYILDLTARRAWSNIWWTRAFRSSSPVGRTPAAMAKPVSTTISPTASTKRCGWPANSARRPGALVGYCIGGTLVSTYMAWASRHYAADQVPVAHWTLFPTLTDFSHPGDIDVFIDEACVGPSRTR